MCPTPSMFDVIDRTRGYPVVTGDCMCIFASSETIPDCANFGFVKLGAPEARPLGWLPCTSLLTGTALGKHILRIFPFCSRKQVSRIDTSAVIACMQNARFVIGDVSVHEKEGDSVRTLGALVADTDLAVPASSERRLPFPAIVRSRLANLLPKQIDLSWGKINAHRVLLTLGAMPGVVTAMPRLSVLSSPLYQIGGAR